MRTPELVNQLPMGARMGAYEIGELIGLGGAGRVYKGRHPVLDRQVAIKVLNLLGNGDPLASARFEQEAKAIASLHHRHIVTVYDYGEADGVPYMVCEYVEGGSLASRMGPANRPDTEESMRILRDVASALDYAHKRGIVHRDVKPANILLSAENGAVLADFGLAKLVDESSLHSMTGITSGTPAYIAPEQVSGKEMGAAVDVYSLGVVAFQLLTGRVPFNEDGVMRLLYAHVNTPPPAASSIRPHLGPRVDAVFARALAKDPAQRWPTCAAFLDALEAALREPATQPVPVVRPPARPTNKRLALLLAVSLLPLALSWPADRAMLAASDRAGPVTSAFQFNGGLLPAGFKPQKPVGPAGSGSVVGTASDPTGGGSGSGSIEAPPPGSGTGSGSGSAPAPAPTNPAPQGQAAPTSVPPQPPPNPSFSYSPNPVRIDHDITVTGSNYDPSRRVMIAITQSANTQELTGGRPVTGNGTFNFTGTVSGGFNPGPATLTVCYQDGSGCRSASITLAR